MIRLTIPSIEEDDLKAVEEVLKSGFLVQGQNVAAFENALGEYIGVKHAIAVSNGTAALHLALLALGVGPGDLVIVTAYSFTATANVIELCGAQPVFIDIDPDTFNMNPVCLEEELNRLMSLQETGRRVKVVLPVHAFGLMADMPKILEIAGKYEIPVVEDSACALGASIEDRAAGTLGIMGCFSFHPRKAITTGEGGLISTNDSKLAKKLRALRNHGLDPDSSSPDFILSGFNYRMTEFQAALGRTQMSKLDRLLSARIDKARNYDHLLADTPFETPLVPENSKHIFQSYVIRLPLELASKRSELIGQMKIQGVETTIGTWHMPLTSYFRSRYSYKPGDFPATDEVFARSLTIPLHEHLLPAEQEHVVQMLSREVYNS